jgi:hypothetical protein
VDKFSIYFTKAFTVVLVLLVFVLSTQMERDMDFTVKHRPPAISYISKSVRPSLAHLAHLPSKQKQENKHKHPRKMHVAKHISLKLAVPTTDASYHLNLLETIAFTPSLPDAYRFLFFREINPPPPKSC